MAIVVCAIIAGITAVAAWRKAHGPRHKKRK